MRISLFKFIVAVVFTLALIIGAILFLRPDPVYAELEEYDEFYSPGVTAFYGVRMPSHIDLLNNLLRRDNYADALTVLMTDQMGAENMYIYPTLTDIPAHSAPCPISSFWLEKATNGAWVMRKVEECFVIKYDE